MEQEEVTTVQAVPEIIYQQELALIDKQVATAKQFPRNIKRATDNAIAIVTMDNETAESCSYALKRWDSTKQEYKIIPGPSVHLARIIAQCWGNMRVETRVTDIGATQVTSESSCWDLESNLAVKTQVKRSISSKSGKRFSEDMVVVTGNAASAIALRNAVFNVVPKGIVRKIESEAKKKLTGDLSDETKLIAKRKAVFDKFRDSYGVTEQEVLSAIGKASIDNVTVDDILVLIGIGTALRDGDTTVDQAFRTSRQQQKEPTITHEELQKLFDENTPVLGAQVFKNGKRILENKEMASYAKLAEEIQKEIDNAKKEA